MSWSHLNNKRAMAGLCRAVACCFLFSGSLLSQAEVYDVSPPEKAPRQVIVGVKQGANFQAQFAIRRNARERRALRVQLPPGRQGVRAANVRVRTEVLELADGVDLGSEIARLQQIPSVAFVEPNYPIRLLQEGTAKVPNDFEFSKLYNLNNMGENGGKIDADIDAPEAWAFTTGSKAVRVAVIDTGIDYLHEDLRDNIWVNEGEIDGDGIDNDGNGYIDDVYGYDFVSGDSDPFDDQEHGTHVAGTIGAKGNNELGVVGVCWDVSLMALKAFDERGNGTVADAVEAIYYAVANGAKVINASWGLDERSFALEQAARFAAESGVLMVAAAGNQKSDKPNYPAAYEDVLSVAATDHKDARATFSNYGPDIDLAAPGQNILSTVPENGYSIASGTSMAAPHVVGIAALVFARYPNYTADEVRDILVNSSDSLITDKNIGRGRINAAKAVQVDQPLPKAELTLTNSVAGEIAVTGTASGLFFTGYSLAVAQGRLPTEWQLIGQGTTAVRKGVLGVLNTANLNDGEATVRLNATNQNGQIASDIAVINIQNTRITWPLSADILKHGGRIEIRGRSYRAGSRFELFVGRGLLPKTWEKLADGLALPDLDTVLSEWDTIQEEPNQFYAIKMVSHYGTNAQEVLVPGIYLDAQLKPGWPQQINTGENFSATDWRNVRVADLDGDGTKELVLVDPAGDQAGGRLLVYNHHGEMLWSRDLGRDIGPDIPVIGDLDGDGAKEIIVDGEGQIVVFRNSGAPLLSGWPQDVSARNLAKVLADVNADGRLELITCSQGVDAAGNRELNIYDATGTRLRQWILPPNTFTNDVQQICPAVGNLDDDPQLEIVVVHSSNQIACFDITQETAVWVGRTEGALLSSPVIGDVDGDGENDIVIGAAKEQGFEFGGIHVFRGNGELWPGWPALEEYSFLSTPALGDLDGDGHLEICAPDPKTYALHLVQWDGFEAEGWPITTLSRTTPDTAASIGDVTGDGLPEVVLSAPGLLLLAVMDGDSNWIGGVQAWDIAGKVVPLSDGLTATLPMEVTPNDRWHKSAPAVLVDLDGNGKLDIIAASVQDLGLGDPIYFKNRNSVYTWELNIPVREDSLPWPMFAHDPQNTAAYSLPVVPTNPRPTNELVALRDRILAVEDTPMILRVLDNDLKGGAASIQIASFTQPAHGRITMEPSGQLALTLNTNYSGFDEFTYSIRDNLDRESTARVLLKVKPKNDSPIAADQSFEINKNGSLNVIYKATDSEGDKLSFRIVTGPQHGELWNYPGIGNYYPTKGFHGTDSFTYAASDGKSESAPAMVLITIINSNNPPEAIEQEVITKPDRPITIALLGRDPDEDPITFELTIPPAHGVVETNGNAFRYIPETNYIGTDSFWFRAFDGTEYSEQAKVSIAITPTNYPPIASFIALTVSPNTSTDIRLAGRDPDGDELEFTILQFPAHGTLTGLAPTNLIYTPQQDYLGPDRFTFKVSDGQIESEPAEVALTVERVNHRPKAADMSLSTLTNTPLALTLKASDEDGDVLRAVILKGTSSGRIYGRGLQYTFVPLPNYQGVDTFSYKIWDGQRFSEASSVSIFVTATPMKPLPSFGSIAVTEGQVELQLMVLPNKAFSLESSTNLVNWELLAGPLTNAVEAFNYTDTNAPGPGKFYRAISER